MLKIISTSLAILTIIPLVLTYNAKRKTKPPKIKKKYEYEFIFVTFRNRTCMQHLYPRIPCQINCSVNFIKKIVHLIDSAQESLSICMYHITMGDFFYAVLRAMKRGVKIRWITDFAMKHCTGSMMLKIKGKNVEGIETRCGKAETEMMHHKFMLIDEHGPNKRLTFGSSNYTLQAFTSNWETIVITNEQNLIARFSEEFENLWIELA